MKLSTGKIAFPIEFDNGDKTAIYFNPSDPNLAIRLKDFKDRISERIKDIDEVELTNEGVPSLDEGLAAIEQYRSATNALCEELDIAFGGDISAEVFKYCSPFAIVDGRYFVIQFIEAISPEIEKYAREANAKAEKNMEKHIAKYMR